MSKPDDISQDIWLSAIKCAEVALRNLDADYGDMTIEITVIARAIMAERERCARIAESVISKAPRGGHKKIRASQAVAVSAGNIIAHVIRTEKP